MTEPVKNTSEDINLPKEEKNEKGASLVEYALLVALIAIVCIVAVRALGTSISGQFNNLSGQLAG
jgi:pilus assembly protein Flp/PilA